MGGSDTNLSRQKNQPPGSHPPDEPRKKTTATFADEVRQTSPSKKKRASK
jgi:hypothetical protein